jgi:outer membrane protein assembly factor BamA
VRAAWRLGSALLLVAAGARAEQKNEAEPRNEFTILPIAGGDSDIGLGAGYIASFARLEPERKPYLFRLESAGAVSFLPHTEDDSLELSYLDDYLLAEFPHVLPNRLKLSFRASYTLATTLKFYGIGNASSIDPGRKSTDDYYEYERAYPTLKVRATFHATRALDLNWGVTYEEDRVTVPADGQLAETMAGGSEAERALLAGTGKFGVVSFLFGAAWDTRDEEVSAHSGYFQELRTELAPGGSGHFPQRWARADAISRVYVPLVPKRLTFAVRAVADLLFGEPPFFELSRFDGSSAIGGARGVRGVPADRYYGKIKFFGNVELRSELVTARFFGKRNVFGVTGFFDTGRVFADYRSLPELDGTGLGLKYGTGGGLRLHTGDSFVLRLDVAYSPDANPVGVYLTSGECF